MTDTEPYVKPWAPIPGDEYRIEVTCRACPLQIEGVWMGVPFHFRSRHGFTTLWIPMKPGQDPMDGFILWKHQSEPTGPDDVLQAISVVSREIGQFCRSTRYVP